ncbi:hypothetical protein C8J56DRAFT_214843 [Mycena floridula]|nr:hypothetical protein C8J56DRAFT_214843 [Mycena floridula]
MSYPSTSAFFYGTCMDPKVLTQTTRNKGAGIQVCSAVLMDYTRHSVKHAVYPAIVPYSNGKDLFKRELSRDERSVRGALVTGLSPADFRLLDQFEGSRYSREDVFVYPLSKSVPLSDYVVEDTAPPLPSDLPTAVYCQTYVYKDIHNLDPEPWSFQDFVKNSQWKSLGYDGPEDLDSEEDEEEQEVYLLADSLVEFSELDLKDSGDVPSDEEILTWKRRSVEATPIAV